MSTKAPILNRFTRGELSPEMTGQYDSPAYPLGCIKIRNMIVKSLGGAMKAPGTYFCKEVKNSSKKVRLVAFSPDPGSRYILEVGHNYIRYYKNKAQIGAPYETATTYDEADLFSLKFTQIFHDLYIAHGSYDPAKLEWTNDTSWNLNNTVAWAGQTFTGAGNRPTCVAYFDQRLIFGRRQKLFASKPRSYADFAVGTGAPGDGIETELGSKRNAETVWLEGADNIVAGCDETEFRIDGSQGIFTPEAIFTREQTDFGSADVQGKTINQVVFFVQKGGTRVIEYAYFADKEAYKSADLTMLAEHVLGAGVVEFAKQSNPQDVIWFVTEDGNLVSLSYSKELNVLAWAIHETDGDVESVAVLKGTTEDEVWISVKRTIDGATKRYIEYFVPWKWTVHRDSFFVRCGITQDLGASKTIEQAYAENPVRVKCTGHGLSTADRIRITGCTKMPDINNQVFAIVKVDNDYFTLKDENNINAIDGSGYSIGTGDWGQFEKVTKTVTGLGHLEAKTVAIMGDGATFAQRAVDSGEIELESWVNTAHVGLPYDAILSPMPLVPTAYGGQQKSRVVSARVRFLKSVGCEVGPDEEHLHHMKFREGANLEPFTGIKSITVEGGFQDEPTIVFKNGEPQPFTILSIMPEMEANIG